MVHEQIQRYSPDVHALCTCSDSKLMQLTDLLFIFHVLAVFYYALNGENCSPECLHWQVNISKTGARDTLSFVKMEHFLASRLNQNMTCRILSTTLLFEVKYHLFLYNSLSSGIGGLYFSCTVGPFFFTAQIELLAEVRVFWQLWQEDEHWLVVCVTWKQQLRNVNIRTFHAKLRCINKLWQL